MRSDKISSLVKPSAGGAGSNGLSAYEVASSAITLQIGSELQLIKIA